MQRYGETFTSRYIFLLVPLIGCFCHEGSQTDRGSCVVSTDDFNEKQPLILQARGAPKIMYPDVTSPTMIKLRTDEAQVRLLCPMGLLTVKSAVQNVSSALLVCLDGTTLRFGNSQNEISSFKEIGCTREPTPVVRMKGSRARGGSSIRTLEIGFQLNVFDFVAVIESISVDVETLQIFAAYVKIQPGIESRQIGRGASPLRMGPMYRGVRVHVADVYRRCYQRQRFMRIFDDPLLVDQYFSSTGEEFLTASQLVSEQDFFYTAQQEATSFYETNSPVWYSIAAGNWQLVGELVRKLAVDSANDLHVWSGTIDVLKLPDRRGCPRNIYLAEDSQGRQLIPVPKLLYKYVYDCHRHRGLVLITVNDPHLVYGITNDMILCPELHVCQELNPNFRSVKRGFTYCCNLQGFAPIARALDLPTFPGAAPLHA